MLVSEQTRQFYAYRDIAGRFLPHVFGAFRATLEEHLPVALINDWDLTNGQRHRIVPSIKVLMLPERRRPIRCSVQAAAIRQVLGSR